MLPYFLCKYDRILQYSSATIQSQRQQQHSKTSIIDFQLSENDRTMIINRNAINTSILHNTLQEEVTRLRRMCSQPNLIAIQRTLLSTQQKFEDLQRNYTLKNDQNQQKRSYQLQIVKELIESRKQKDVHLSETVQLNWQLLSQLQKMRVELREKQAQSIAEQKKGVELNRDYLKRQERIKSIELKSQDLLEAIKKSLFTAALCKEQKTKLLQQMKRDQNELQIEKILRSRIQSDILSLHQQLNLLRIQKIETAHKATEQKFNFIKLEEAYTVERSALQNEKEQKTITAADYEASLQERTNLEQGLFLEVEAIQETAANIEAHIVKNLNTTQSIESSLFETKVARTAAKTTATTLRNKINRLKELKQSLISIVAYC